MHRYFICGFIRFFVPDNVGVYTKIMILCQLELDILPRLYFMAAILKNCRNTYRAPTFFLLISYTQEYQSWRA